MGLWIPFKPSVLADFFWHCSSKGMRNVASLVADHGRCPVFPTWPPLITERQGEVLVLTGDRDESFHCQTSCHWYFTGWKRVGMHCYCSLYGLYWCHRVQCEILNPYEVLFENTSGEYGVLLLRRVKILASFLPPWSLLKLVEDMEEPCYLVMDWYCFSFRMSPLLA